MNCELCNKPLDAYALSNESGYCSECTDSSGTLFEVLNYFKVSLENELFASAPEMNGKPIEWPHVKNPDLWHRQACRLFPGWGQLVSEFRALKGIKYFDVDALKQLIEYARSIGDEKTYEELCIMKRARIVTAIMDERSAITMQRMRDRFASLETAETHKVAMQPLPLLGHQAPQDK